MEVNGFQGWVTEVVGAFRKRGFFWRREFEGLTNEECGNVIASKWRMKEADFEKWRGDRRRSLSMEMFVVREDLERIWSADSEGVYHGTNFYVMALQRMGQISAGAFDPTAITERWSDAEDGKGSIIEVTFQSSGSERHLWITARSDFAPRGLITLVNSLIQQGTWRFRLYSDSQDWLVSFQGDEDAAWMQSRGWPLTTSDEVQSLLEFPISLERAANCGGEKWLYFRRGWFRRTRGDEQGAWEDWMRAHKLGLPDVYKRVATMEGETRKEG